MTTILWSAVWPFQLSWDSGCGFRPGSLPLITGGWVRLFSGDLWRCYVLYMFGRLSLAMWRG